MNPMFALFIVALVCIVLIQAEDWRRAIARRLAPHSGSTQRMSDAELDARIAELEAELRPSKSRTALAYEAPTRAVERFSVAPPSFSEFADEPPAVVKPALPIAQLVGALHLFVSGETGGGKTVLLHELTRQWVKRGARVMVCDCDARAGFWPGCEVFGATSWYEDMAKAIREFEAEFDRRNRQYLKEELNYQPWYLVVDEFKHAHKATGGRLQEIAEKITERGRKLGLHMVIGTQSDKGGANEIRNIQSFKKNFTYVVELFQGFRSTIRKGNGDWIGEYTTPRLPVPEERYFNPHDPRYERFEARLASKSPTGDLELLAQEMTRPMTAPPRTVEQLADELMAAVLGMAAELPPSGEVSPDDYDVTPGFRYQGDAALKTDSFDALIEHLGMSDQRREVVEHLLTRGLLESQAGQPTYMIKVAKRPTRTYRFKVSGFKVSGFQSTLAA